jgi:hypothetical protein
MATPFEQSDNLIERQLLANMQQLQFIANIYHLHGKEEEAAEIYKLLQDMEAQMYQPQDEERRAS